MVQRLTRLPDWRARFAAEMDRQHHRAFEWGRHDCVLGLAGGAVKALTGVDLIPDWRGRYRSERGALRALRHAGFTGLPEALAAHLPQIHPDAADIGDLAVVASDGPLKAALAIVDSSSLIVMTPNGHGRMPREGMLHAYKIG